MNLTRFTEMFRGTGLSVSLHRVLDPQGRPTLQFGWIVTASYRRQTGDTPAIIGGAFRSLPFRRWPT